MRHTWFERPGRVQLMLAALVTLALPQLARAQTGSVTGTVTAAGAGAGPLGDSRVLVAGTNLGVTTNQEGKFTLRGVPTGPVIVQVFRVGYQGQKKTVTVTAGQTSTADFVMERAVVELPEIVATATGEQRKIELGNSVAAVADVSTKVEQEPITNMSDLLTAKVPGVQTLAPNMTGAAPVVRVRGISSLSLSNEPIYVIDGVRMNSAVNNGGVGGTNTSYLNDLSPDEIEEIQVVKGPSAATLYGTDAANGVILITTKKGRSGNTRWNWFAEGGSVQDKNHYLDQYALWGHDPTTNALKRCVAETVGDGTCVADSTTAFSILNQNGYTPIANGNRNEYGMNTSGGSDAVRFFVSGDLENEIGPVKMPGFAAANLDSIGCGATLNCGTNSVRDEWMHPEAFQRGNYRTNLNASLSPTFDLGINAGFSQTNQRLPQVDNNSFSYIYNAYQGPGFQPAPCVPTATNTTCKQLDYNALGSLGEDLHGYRFYSPAQILQVLREQGDQRTIGSANATWRPFSWMDNDGTVGVDLASRDQYSLCRFGECPNSGTTRLGSVTDTRTTDRDFTAKLTSNSSWLPRPDVSLKTTVGADYVNQDNEFSVAQGSQLPPGGQSANQAAIQSAQSQQEKVNKTLGLYVQEQAGLRDLLFLTAAVRTDQNSSFGTNFQRVYYPKFSASYVISDEKYFPRLSWLDQLRLRAAWGASGVQPGATTALTTLGANAVNVATVPGSASGSDTPGIRETQLPNPFLRPERSTEGEMGFESKVLQNRVNIDFTYYSKTTRDALVNVPIGSSSGAPVTQVLENIGSVANSGLELSVTTTIMDRRNFGWDIQVSGSHNSNKITSIGSDSTGKSLPTIGTGTTRDSLGMPINGFFLKPFTYADTAGGKADGIITKNEVTVGALQPGATCTINTCVVYMGYSTPRDLVTVSNGFDFLNRKLHIQVSLDYRGGYGLNNQTVSFYCQQTNTCFDETHGANGLLAPSATASPTGSASSSLFYQARNIAQRYTAITTGAGYIENGQFWRLREIGATIALPDVAAQRIRARDASLTLTARNLHVWTRYTGIDPESNYGTGDVQTDFSTTAPPRYLIARLNLHY